MVDNIKAITYISQHVASPQRPLTSHTMIDITVGRHDRTRWVRRSGSKWGTETVIIAVSTALGLRHQVPQTSRLVNNTCFTYLKTNKKLALQHFKKR